MIARDRRPGPTVRPKVSAAKVETLMVYILRSSAVFNEARRTLTANHFDDEPHLAAIWVSFCELADKFGHSTVTEDMLHLATAERIEAGGNLIPYPLVESVLSLPDAELGTQAGLLNRIYAIPADEPMNADYGLTVLKEFLEERAVAGMMRQRLLESGDATPLAMGELIETFRQQAQTVAAIGAGNVVRPFMPSDWSPQRLETVSTGLGFFNSLMGGGQAPGEVYGMVGPYGGGKTLIGLQLAIESARVFLAAHANGAPLKHVYYVYYEGTPIEFYNRTMAYAAQISKNALEQLTDVSQLSRRGHLKAYERELLLESGYVDLTNAPGEYERLMAAGTALNQNFFTIDMSGGQVQERGGGGPPEIESILSINRDKDSHETGLIVIDYCMKAVERELESRGGDISKLARHAVRAYPDRCRRHLASRFNCPVWVLHQLRGEANALTASSKIKVTDAAESKGFAENLVYFFGLSKMDPETKIATLHCDKDRRSGHMGEHRLLKIQGEFARAVCVDSDYVIDPVSSRIVNRRELAEIGAVPTISRPQAGTDTLRPRPGISARPWRPMDMDN